MCVWGVTLPAPRGAGAGTAKGELADRRCRGLRPAGVAAGTWDPGRDLGGPSEAADRSWGRWALPVPLRDFLRIRNLHAIPQLRRTKGALQGGRPQVPQECLCRVLRVLEEPGGNQLFAGLSELPACASPQPRPCSPPSSPPRCPGLWSRQGWRGLEP